MSSKQPSSNDKVVNSDQGSLITSQMSTWLNSLYDYYSKDNAIVSQTMQKVIVHLDAISGRLKATYPPTSSLSSGGPQSPDAQIEMKAKSNTKEDVQMVKEPEKQNIGLVEYSLSSESLPETIPAVPAVTGCGKSNISMTKAATESNKNSPVKSADSSLLTTANQKDTSTVINSTELTCCICLEVVSEVSGRKYALLEQCAHPYCEPCVRSLLEHNGRSTEPIQCPTCRTASARIIVSKTFLPSGSEKTALFDKLICCPPHDIPSNQSHSEEDENAGEEEEVFNLVPTLAELNEMLNDSDLTTSYSSTDTEADDDDDPDLAFVDLGEQNQDSDDNLDLVLLNSSVSLGSGQSIDFSIEITERPTADVIYEEDSAGELHLIWSPDEDEAQVDNAVEATSDEDFIYSYSSSDEETDNYFEF